MTDEERKSQWDSVMKNISIGNAHLEIDGIACGPLESISVERLRGRYYITCITMGIVPTSLACLCMSDKEFRKISITHIHAETQEGHCYTFTGCYINADESSSVKFGNTDELIKITLHFICAVVNSEFTSTEDTGAKS